ncbi:MAG TPA: OmpA family protein [Pyrinomonadaceae bacterium]|jgi:outer membrane protein OmpA-like peptidoglycan-associated protein
MSVYRTNTPRRLAWACALVLSLTGVALAQTDNNTPARANARTVASGQKMKIKGVVTQRSADTFTVQDANGVETTVLLTDRTSVKSSGGFLRSGSTYGPSNILRGLNLEVEGRGDSSGQLVADKIRFNGSDLRVAQSIQARVDPVENDLRTTQGRVSEVEANAQRLSGQLDELAAVSNAARGGAKAAQETADAAVAGVNATNERISALDDYTVQNKAVLNFKVGSSVLSPESKTALDQVAQQALNARGFMIEVRGFASADGSEEANRRLSQRRADAVVRYLAETHNIPLRRIITPFGYGEAQAVADNASRAGREQNRRVEVSVLVNRGLLQSAPNLNPTRTDSAGAPPPDQPQQ